MDVCFGPHYERSKKNTYGQVALISERPFRKKVAVKSSVRDKMGM